MAAPCWLFRNARYGFGRIKSTPPQFRITASVLRASTSPSKDSPNSIVKPLAKTGQYVFSKFKFFLEGYDKILRKFPVAYRLHQVFVVGTKDLYQDVRTYMKISQDLRSGKSVRELSRSELELYYRVPRDMLKMVPILTIISLPGTNFIMFPLIYLFPGHLLTWQFWSLEQRIDFAVAQQRKKVRNYRHVFRHLQTNVPKGEEGKQLLSVFHKLGSGTHPTVAEILDVKQYFSSKPLSLSSLSRNHLVALCKIHGKSTFFLGRKRRLWKHGGFVREMDLAMAREGLGQMDLSELRWACFLRGFNPMGLSKRDMVQYLQDWINISSNIEGDCISLLLHCPILLAYNAPSNWILIH
ncbi:LETM1 domain-containing protein 1-like [Dermacentor silvarum]|uniref:LETM1 domain-containing protein 1-like n=1 Tax=Dermacentor silvarum TaxID=543639 RepID=UPI001898C4F9|nr:LETM1 domain-containing protein 1-like [Dermacentor silvarum]